MRRFSPYLYVLPAAVLIIAFRLVPIVGSFLISFFQWGMNGKGAFIGLQNYHKMISDPEFWRSMINTFYLVVITVPACIAFPLLFAVMLNRIEKCRGFFRSIYFLPTVTSLVAISIVWKIMFNQQTGLMNYFLGMIGIRPIGWLTDARGLFQLILTPLGVHLPFDVEGQSMSHGLLNYALRGPSVALLSVIIATIWRTLGYNTIIYLAGLQSIPQMYYEAASIDGAGKSRQFFRITVPLVSPTTFYILLMTTITTFQVFSQVYLMTGPPIGGPLGTTKVIVYYIYDLGFGEAGNLSYASAVALVLFVIILSITLVQRRLERNVHY
jgi:multiple sugar transport system permease protein